MEAIRASSSYSLLFLFILVRRDVALEEMVGAVFWEKTGMPSGSVKNIWIPDNSGG
jgi:hypothetical protein